MVKGFHGETCAEATRAAIRPGEVVTYSEFVDRIRRQGAWTSETVCEHLMSCVVNLPPARFRWRSKVPFLFLRADGAYELYDPKVHPRVRE